MVEKIVLGLVIAAALAYVVRHAYRAVTRRSCSTCSSGCSGCSGGAKTSGATQQSSTGKQADAQGNQPPRTEGDAK